MRFEIDEMNGLRECSFILLLILGDKIIIIYTRLNFQTDDRVIETSALESNSIHNIGN